MSWGGYIPGSLLSGLVKVEEKATGCPPCPECVAGKCGNCADISWNNDLDESCPCPCFLDGHPARTA